MTYMITLFKMLIAHALCDFTLQTSAMAAGKNRHNKPVDNAVPPGQKVVSIWFYWLTSHALIHAGGAWLVTGSPVAALVMFATHWLIDFAKCENLTNPHHDQSMHMVVIGFLTYYAHNPFLG